MFDPKTIKKEVAKNIDDHNYSKWLHSQKPKIKRG